MASSGADSGIHILQAPLNVCILFMIFCYFSRYSALKLDQYVIKMSTCHHLNLLECVYSNYEVYSLIHNFAVCFSVNVFCEMHAFPLSFEM